MKTAEANARIRSLPLAPMVLAMAGALIPLMLYWLYWGKVPTVLPAEAKRLLRAANNSALLVDVRSRGEFDSQHVDGASNWPLTEILATTSRSDVPASFRDQNLLLLCNAGIASRAATQHLRRLGLTGATNVRGGLQDWIADVPGPTGGAFERWKTSSGAVMEFPFRPMPWYQQVLTVASAYAVKPVYTLLSLALVIILWRRTTPDLAALRWGLVFFFLGENFCAVNYLLFNHTSYFFEYLHSYGMVLSFGFTTYALFEGTDRRVLLLSDPTRKCAALSLCKGCIKHGRRSCGLRQTFYLIIPAAMLLAFIPLCARRQGISYNTTIFGTFYNYSHPSIQQHLEIRYCPAAAILMFAASLLVLALKQENPLRHAKLFFAAGAGLLGFAFLRGALFRMFASDMMWAAFWEETTELLFIAGVCAVLWIFREALFQEPST